MTVKYEPSGFSKNIKKSDVVLLRLNLFYCDHTDLNEWVSRDGRCCSPPMDGEADFDGVA